jgi:hypothetical protein
VSSARLFIVNYLFVHCGDVFTAGLQNAAKDLNLPFETAYWNDPELSRKIAKFAPDLVFTVHGRRLVKSLPAVPKDYKSAVWLVDEPYEVDDTASWSGHFDIVFISDPVTLSRHTNAHYLPMCFDAARHKDAGLKRIHKVGFIGGYSPLRERVLLPLADAGLLSYVVGGPWKAPALQRLCLARKVSADEAARLYQQTTIVLNIFREKHHFNKQALPASSLNPRVYEALACGAVVVTEARSEAGKVFPLIPQFTTPDQAVREVSTLLANPSRLAFGRSSVEISLGTPIRTDCRRHAQPRKNHGIR